MNNLSLKLNQHFYIVVFFAVALFFYGLLYAFNVQTDIQKHIEFAGAMLQGTNFPPTFLYFAAISIFALFQNDYNSLLFASLIVLSFAVAFKFHITARLFAKKTDLSKTFSKDKVYLISNIVGVCLITVFCIYLPKELGLTTHFLIGQIPPNIWSNSTTIFLMPFAILLFWHSYILLEKFEMKDFWMVLVMIFLNIVTKPNFFLCFVAVFPLMALIRYRLNKEFFLCLIPPFFGFALIILEYFAIYRLGTYGYGDPGESGVTIAPLVWWRLYATNIPVSILISAAFPLVYLLFYFKRVKEEPFLYYAYLLFAVGVAILVFFGETGPRESHGNFQWQAMVSNYILFFAVAIDFVRVFLQTRALNLKDKIIVAVFALHLFSGWLYLAKTLIRGNYG